MSITDVQSNRTNFGINKLRDMSYTPKPYVFDCFATMNGQFLVLEDYAYDVFNKIKLGDIKANNFQLFFEIAEIQRSYLSKKGLTEGVEHIDRHLNLLHEGLEKHGDLILEFQRQGYNVLLLNEGIFGDVGDFLNKNIVKPLVKGTKAVIKSVTNSKAYKYTAKKADELFTWVKTKGVALLGKGAMWVMRNLERALFSVVGIAVDIVLAITGLGSLVMAVLWAIVTVYRCILFSQDQTWWNGIMIVLCAIGMLPFGAAVAKGMRVAASGFKAVKSSAGAAKMLKKVFKPKQINFIGKIMASIATLPLKLGKGIAWIAGKFPGMASKAARMTKWLERGITKINWAFRKVGSSATLSSTQIVAGSGIVLGIEYYKQTKGQTLYDPFGQAANDQDVYADYTLEKDMTQQPIGKPIGKIRLDDDFKMVEKGDTLEMVPFSSSPYIESMLKQRIFTGQVAGGKITEGESAGEYTKIVKCSTLGCPPNWELNAEGKVVPVPTNFDYVVPPIEGGEEVEYVPFKGTSEEEYQEWLKSQGYLSESNIIQYIHKQYI